MKIRKAPSKKLAPLPRQLEDLIRRLETEPKEKIPSLVQELSSWPYPRGDLFHWVKVLDRCDLILQEVCDEYNLKQIQTKHFTDQTKTLILSIIDLSCTLFENCTNRNIYNSYEYLCMLLNTFDIDVLQQVLYFMVRPAQRINNPRAIRSSFSVPQDKIIELARGWANVPVDLINIVQDLEVSPKMMTFVLQFYRATSSLTTNNTNNNESVTEGNEIIGATITDEDLKKDDIEVFLKLVEEHNVPQENQFELANRIRITKHLKEPKKRKQLFGIRLLALSIMANAVSETTAQNKVFIFEPHLVSQLAELISPEKQTDITIQTYTLYAMDALIKYRIKLPEVLTAVNASTNHGTLMRILRKINSNEAYPQPFIDALFVFVSYLLQTQTGEQMLISAGIIPTLVQILGNHEYTLYKNIAKLVGLMDSVVNSFSSSFTAFCNVNGLDTLLNRVKLEVEACSEYIMKDDEISAPYNRLSAVKAMLKFLLRMMDTSGTTDGLRNLIDSNLPHSLKLIMEYPKLFGSTILALAINIIATFIHNEPTSLSILQEAQLPQSFLNTISTYDIPSNEVMLASINAFGAVCLNTQGLEMFNNANPIPHFFELMTSEEYVRNTSDLDGTTALGATMDELVRHQPTLKPTLFQCIDDLVQKMIKMGNDVNGNGKPKDNSHVIQTRAKNGEQSDENMSSTPIENAMTDILVSEEGERKLIKVDYLYVLFVDLVGRYLEGIFQNQNNINEFVRQVGSEKLLSIYSSPLLPATFCTTVANNTYAYVFRLICDVSPLPTVLAIASKAKESIRFITERKDGYQKSCLVEFVDVDSQETDKIERGNKLLHQLIEMLAIVSLLSNLASIILTQGKNGPSLLTEFLAASDEGNIIQALGQLYRVIVWETYLLKEELPDDWYNFKAPSATTRNDTTKTTDHGLVEDNSSMNNLNGTSKNAFGTTFEKIISPKDPRIINIKHFKILLKDIPQLLMSIFQGLIKVSVSRRAGTTVTKSQTMELAEFMANLLKDNITWQPINNPNAPACKYDYLASIYNMISYLLRDERPQSPFQTPLAIAFEQQGGVDLLLENLKQLWNKALTLYEEDKEENRGLISRINSSIENLLILILNISSPKLLRDSAYTSSLIQRNKKAKDYFDPYQWIISLELKLTPLKDYLTCSKLHLFSKKVGQTLIKIFQQLMKGEGGFTNSSHSTTANTRHGGGSSGGGGGDIFGNLNTPLMTAPFTLLRAPVVASEHNIQTLLDMGFERAAAEQALVRCNNQVSRAVDYLFSHPIPVFSASTTTNALQSTVETSSHHTDDDNNPDNERNTEGDEHLGDSGNTDDENHHHSDNEDEDEDNDSDNDMEDITNDYVESLNNELPLSNGANLRHFSLNFLDNDEGSTNDNNNEEENDESDVEDAAASENLEKIKSFRQELCQLLPTPLLVLSDKREDLMFDIRDLLALLGKFQDIKSTADDSTSAQAAISATKTSVMIINTLLNQISEIHKDESKSLLLGSRLRLLALLLREPSMQKTINKLSNQFSFLFDMLNLIKLDQDVPLPSWSAVLFLVLEVLIAQADEPKREKLAVPCRHPLLYSSSSDTEDKEENEKNNDNNTDGEDVVMQDVKPASNTKVIDITSEQRTRLLECSVSLLRKSELSRDDIYAILRMIVRLTKDHDSALHFVSIGGIPLLFVKPRSSLDGLQGQQAYIILILRHIVESKTVLKSTMKAIITNWFTNPRPRNMDISSFIRSNAHIALRNPSTFVDVTTNICRLARYDEFEANRHIKLKKQDGDEKNVEIDISGVATTSHTKEKSPSEVVIYYLLNEIMNIHSEATTTTINKEELTEEQKKEENIKFVYTGFLLQCLVELISSYPSCKYDIFNFCKKQNGPRATTSDGKHRSFVSMLINDLLPYNHTNPTSDESRKQQGLSTWTASTLVAMSYDNSSTSDLTSQQKSELIQVRKYVLETIIRALKEAIASTEAPSIKYSRYLAFADLCHRILNARPNFGPFAPRSLGSSHNTSNNNDKEESTLNNAKIMLDKNFVAVLTSAVSDIDINYPHSRAILNALIRPLEQLTKLAIKAEEATDTDEEEQDKMDITEEEIHVPNTSAEEQDEAPDLYRNSALGMFDGSVIDEEEYNSDEYSDMFGSSADEEENYPEDGESDLSDEVEDEETEEMETMMHSGDYDSDEMDEDDEESDDIDAEDELIEDEDDEEDDDEEDGREMTWHLEDIEEEPGIVRAAAIIEAGDENDDQVNIRNLTDPYDEDEDDEEEEMDALSDFDDAFSNAENISTNDINDGILLDAEDLDTPFLPTDLQDDLDIENDDLSRPRTVLHSAFRRRFADGRRSLLEGVGRPFRTPAQVQGQEDIISHPLLSNNNNNGSGFPVGTNGRNTIEEAFSRRAAHSTGLSNWQDFEDIIGGSAVRMLEDILTRATPISQASSLRIDVQSTSGGALRTFEFDHIPTLNATNNNHRSSNTRGTGETNDQVQEILTILQDFQPMTSGERWNQEARMMYGTNISEKALKLVNELLNILIPIAIEDDRKAREEEEQRRQEQRQQEEERRKAEEQKWQLEKEAREAHEIAKSKAEAEASETPSAETGSLSNIEPTIAENDMSTSEPQSQTETTSQTNVESTDAAAGDSLNTERTTITIHGEAVDISGTGIDVEFLEALPDDLREEVINQHIRERPAPTQPIEDDSISPEFLDALPPDIREEVLHQEALERERRERQNRQAPANTPVSTNVSNSGGGASSFEVISSHRRPASAEDDTKSSGPVKKKAKSRRVDSTAQLLEKSQLSTLVRLLFIPQTISKSMLNRLLLNLCENSKTRSELLSYLVCILYDGDNDLNSVENSFALLNSFGKNTKSTQSKFSKHTLMSTTFADNAPNFIAQRCLEALTYIISCNDQSMTYFLTESEALANLKRVSSNRKGKSKEKVPANWNRYPILLLMSLLDRSVFIHNSSLMEQLMDLLSTMCRPFPVLVKKYKEKLENKQKDPSLSERPMPKPPTIPDYYLKLVVHVLTNGECSSKTFQYTLNAISHLSALEGAQSTIVSELVEDAKKSGDHILKDLETLFKLLTTTMDGTEVSSFAIAPFSAATSHQAKLLRVLKTLDYIFNRKLPTVSESETNKDDLIKVQIENESRVTEICENLNFLPLWDTLGKCLSIIHEKEDLINVATVLLPLIESFMVVSKCTAERKHNIVNGKLQAFPSDPTSKLSHIYPRPFFYTFTEKHKKVLNIMVRKNPSLMSGSFSLLVRNPKMLEFDNKRNYFVQQLHKRSGPRENYPQLQLNVRRHNVFEDSYHQLQGRTGDEFKHGKLAVRFYNEEGVDAGGVSREWFSVLARQMFDPNYALFVKSAADKLTYQPNRDSAVNPDHLSFFKFVGRIIGKAIYDGRLLDAYFTRSFYKHILGRSVDYRDVEALDPEYYKSLVWMLENDITDIIDLTFSIETDYFGTKETVDLKPNGRNIPVTEENKHEYVALVTEQKLTTAIKDQINAFVQGFHDIIPAHLIQIFNEQELELLISGLPDIDIDDWKNNTEYQGYTSSSPPVQWFWRAVRSFDQEERAKLLQFATGTSKVPLEGFSQLQGSNGVQKFQIHKDFGGENRLPSAHTCFNQIDLPQYDSYESLRTNLFKAISECSTGFAFV
ncbi:uncharacterized protein BX663DRAFT_482482 [Cokeromyces recurvatus]|uniref:uncharacterized protein n=1 Tax=Cokeromyces recurvatus TaxID=90255 RepID=UPI0022201F06|nr:uncharacterized protein BX663DRAFT_482482 [Cokeromyces recurvatus]KAI7908284.1 hypothetical protein BX663DRAFT_482482 [Cokeromyces recurvatus]